MATVAARNPNEAVVGSGECLESSSALVLCWWVWYEIGFSLREDRLKVMYFIWTFYKSYTYITICKDNDGLFKIANILFKNDSTKNCSMIILFIIRINISITNTTIKVYTTNSYCCLICVKYL